MIRILEYQDLQNHAARGLTARKAQQLEEAERVVAPILADVREQGDAALLAYARKFDRFAGSSVRIHVDGFLEPEFEQAVTLAAHNIREYARLQLPEEKFKEH